MLHFSTMKTPETLQFFKFLEVKKMQHCLKLGLMVDVDVQGTLKITMICRVGSRDHGQRNRHVHVFQQKKLGNLNTFRLVKLPCDVK